MASPFAVFRKNQKMLIATLGLLAMIAFVFLPIILQNMGGREVKNPLVVKTKRFGDINEQRLDGMIRQRQMVLNFLERAVSISGTDPRFVRMYLESYIGPTTEEAVVDAWLRAQMATEMGLDVTDTEVNAFLKEVTGDRVTSHQFNEILSSLRISQAQLFAAFRTELLAMNFRQLFSQSIEGSPPAERWDYYQRLNRRATVEIAPIPVAKFVSRVAEPDEGALQAFFDKYKEEYSDPASVEPGFRDPQKIALEYFKASYDDFIDPKSVTEEEVKQHYEQFKDVHYLAADLPSLDDEEEKAESGKPKAEGKEPAAKPEAEKEGAKKPADSSSERRDSPFCLASFL